MCRNKVERTRALLKGLDLSGVAYCLRPVARGCCHVLRGRALCVAVYYFEDPDAGEHRGSRIRGRICTLYFAAKANAGRTEAVVLAAVFVVSVVDKKP